MEIWTEADTHNGKMKQRDTKRRWPSAKPGERFGAGPSLTALRRSQPCWHLDFKLLTSRPWESKFLLCRLSSLWYFVKTALGNYFIYFYHGFFLHPQPQVLFCIIRSCSFSSNWYLKAFCAFGLRHHFL